MPNEDLPDSPVVESIEVSGDSLMTTGISNGEVFIREGIDLSRDIIRITTRRWDGSQPQWGAVDSNLTQNTMTLGPNSPQEGSILINSSTLDSSIRFFSKFGEEVLRIAENGDFFVRGKLIDNDREVLTAFRLFLGVQLSLPPQPGSREGIQTRYKRVIEKLTED